MRMQLQGAERQQLLNIFAIGIIVGVFFCVAVLLMVGLNLAAMTGDGIYRLHLLGLPIARGERSGFTRSFIPEMGMLLLLLLPAIAGIMLSRVRRRWQRHA